MQMDQRTQRQLKALQNKLSNITADIALLENEINLTELLREKEDLTREQTEYITIQREEHELCTKIDECINKIKEYEASKLAAEHTKKMCLYEEQEIYTNEQARIAFAFGEWQSYMHEKLNELTMTRDEIQDVLRDLIIENDELDTLVNNYSGVKRDLRLQNMNMILAQQMAYKQDKELYKTYKDTVASLLLEKSQYEAKVNTYTQDRYNINNDYYMWKCECDHLEKEGDNPTPDDCHKLFEERAKLSRDPRQDYKMRYMKLDADLAHCQSMIKRIDKQLAKLEAVKKERPILRLNKNLDEHALLVEYHNAKKTCTCLQQQIDMQRCMLDTIQNEIDSVQNDINTGYRPNEITEFEERAKQRLAIMTSRLNEKYTHSITELDIKIGECRQLLTAYQEKYDSILKNKSKKGVNMNAITNSLEALNIQLERKTLLDRLLKDKEQILESINLLSN